MFNHLFWPIYATSTRVKRRNLDFFRRGDGGGTENEKDHCYMLIKKISRVGRVKKTTSLLQKYGSLSSLPNSGKDGL